MSRFIQNEDGTLSLDNGLAFKQNGDDTLYTMGDKSNLLGGNGNDMLKVVRVETLYSSSIKTGDGDNKINVGTAASSSRIETGAGNDSISVSGIQGKSSILSGGGNDSILMEKALESIMDGGAGDDEIYVKSAANSMIMGGEGDDTMTMRGTRLIVDGGAGNNTTSVAASNSMRIDNGRLISNSISAEDAQEIKNDLTHTIETVPMDGESRQKYQALLHYATEQASRP